MYSWSIMGHFRQAGERSGSPALGSESRGFTRCCSTLTPTQRECEGQYRAENTFSERRAKKRGECDVSAQSDNKCEDQLFIQVQKNAKHSLVHSSKCLRLCSSHCGLNLSGFLGCRSDKRSNIKDLYDIF